MSHVARLLTTLAVASLLTACGANRQVVKPAKEVIEKPVKYYVPIDPDLRKRCKWRDSAPIDAIFEVSGERKACLIQYEIQLDGIDKVQGNAVPEEVKP
ncbi:MAG: hypothetical protein ACREO8_10680 [Luteimonas sp.]